ncbi:MULTISPECIES: non-heme iron oxygenase ferredoxin subunit [Acinetobacter]|jgi:nitrite reductase/ring-hydroxylating ferredoxin subunit|uniref:Non-heme iron oxygenase ferredoxin subunit n=1 Tax=Acinetobacter nematophilus TaxID=2994642 RepID=A0A9X3DUC1_9GAMM|nr:MULTISPECIES: non-heme iron oxygenase ferredoxin subunit [Acinetobacter]MBJ9953332.1 non-heme iron oxygenase ferredoxin subunit [Acinetobacter baumannii]MCX5467997.1 non-heme iron oxygenase ferredoxin subunit [Acinetobacter nematophilus]
MSWISVCQPDDISQDEPKAIEVNGKKIGVFFIDDQYFAIENVCPHAFALLTEGFIEEQTVECPLHEAIFNIQTGELVSGPGCRDLCTYPVRVEGLDVQIQL